MGVVNVVMGYEYDIERRRIYIKFFCNVGGERGGTVWAIRHSTISPMSNEFVPD
jgi:hypothetical protein